MTKLPPEEATDLVVHDLSGEAVHESAVMTWRDGSGKLQHAYTQQFHEANAARKWERVQELEPRMDEFRAVLNDQVASGEVGAAEHEGALIAAIIAETGLRPGNATSAKAGKYGVSTLRPEHIEITGDTATLSFIGKSGKENVATVESPELVSALAAYQERAGDGPMFSGSSTANARDAAPDGVKLKDFRTIVGTRTAERAMEEIKPPPPLDPDEKKAKKQIATAIKEASSIVADRLNNTPSVAKTSYIHPRVFEEWAASLNIPEGF